MQKSSPDHQDDVPIFHERITCPDGSAGTRLIWAHGWGQTGAAFLPLAKSLSGRVEHVLLDFPGFGKSPMPPSTWGTADYADAVAPLLSGFDKVPRTIWIGHSFGGRVGIQLAVRHKDVLDGLFLIASAGVPRRRSLAERARIKSRIATYKTLRRLAPLLNIDTDALRAKFGSADYRMAGELRQILVKVVNEDLSDVAPLVTCPARLVYGAEDKETPPDVGERLSALIPNSKLHILQGLDHYSVLGDGRHQVLKRLREFMEQLK